MLDVLRLTLAAMVAASLGLVAAYAIGFVVIALVTKARRRRPDPLARELDRVLDEILGRGETSIADSRRRLARASIGGETADRRATDGERRSR